MRAITVKNRTTFVLVSLLVSAVADALPPHWNTVGPYMTLHLQGGSTDESAVEFYLDGVCQGFQTANAALSQSGQARLFCASDIELNGKNYRSLLDEILQDMLQRDKGGKPGSRPFSSLSYVPLSIPLLQALQNKFPCGKK
jgi:hypothetical protein